LPAVPRSPREGGGHHATIPAHDPAPTAAALARALRAVLDAAVTPACARADHDADRCPFCAARALLARAPHAQEAR